jgi:hypothetical protein
VAGTTQPSATGVYEKLTSTASYTGSHKERFGEDGQGLGKAGRTEAAASTAHDLSADLRTSARGGTSLASAHAERKSSTGGSGASAGGAHAEQAHPPAHAPHAGGGVFDRLTSTASYTGSHKERFGEDGQGLGRAGRTEAAASTAHDLSADLRSSMRGGTSLASAHAERRGGGH